MSVTNHTITVTVNGVDKTTSLLKDSLFIRLQQKNKSTAELKFKNFDPPERAETIIYVNGTAVFGGYIVRKSASIQGVPSNPLITWSCDLRDWSELLETVKVTKQYTQMSDADIVFGLFDEYFPTSGFDAVSDVDTLQATVVNFNVNDVSASEVLDQLAKLVGASWYIKPDKSVVWFDKASGYAASFGISSNPNNTTTFGFLKDSLSYEVDSSTIVNQVKVIAGVTADGEKISEFISADGVNKTWPLLYQPNSIAYCSFDDGVGVYNVYGSFVGYAPQDKLRSEGGSYLVVIDQIAKTISMEGSSGLPPANSTQVSLEYYKKTLVYSTFDDLSSQGMFGIYPVSIQDKEFSSYEAAEDLASAILEQNAFGRTSIKFETTKYGLLPGQLVSIDISELNVMQGWVDNVLIEEDSDNLTIENGDFILLESYASGRTFIVQDVSIQPVITKTNEFMLVCQVTAGKYTPNLIDALSSVAELRSSTGTHSLTPVPTKLSNISNDLGIVQVGRAEFTNGGTARYQWGTPNLATGLVMGLEDTTDQYGVVYIYDQGTMKVKLGRMEGLPDLGTVTPSGWGIYTENGYFKGVVAASKLLGGTIEGSLITGNTITGGTISGNYVTGGTIDGGTVFAPRIVGGTISSGVIETNTLIGNTLSANTITSGTLTSNNINSGTITGNLISGGTVTGTRITGGSIVGNTIIGGTIATGTPPLNSSNPGVLMDATGLYGYDDLGLTFRLSTNPAIKPFISSGTVTEVTVEVSTNAVIRTGTINPRVQIDNSGIFAYDSGGNLKFSVTSAEGLLSAVDGEFQGTVYSSLLSANNIDGGTITGNVLIGNNISGGTITGNQIIGGTVSASKFTGGTVEAGTITGAYISGGTVSGGNGTALLKPTGLEFTLSSGTAFADEPNLKWKRSSTNAAIFGGRYDGSNDYLWGEAGVSGTKRGVFNVITFGTSSNTYNYYEQHDAAFNFWEIKSGSVQLIQSLTHDEIAVYKSIVPYNTYTTVNLGSATTGFRYLYMRDSSNVIWKVEVNTSGVLVVSAA